MAARVQETRCTAFGISPGKDCAGYLSLLSIIAVIHGLLPYLEEKIDLQERLEEIK